jgi:hypothetical protein
VGRHGGVGPISSRGLNELQCPNRLARKRRPYEYYDNVATRGEGFFGRRSGQESLPGP